MSEKAELTNKCLDNPPPPPDETVLLYFSAWRANFEMGDCVTARRAMLDVRFVSRLLATLVLLIPVFVAVSPTPASAEVVGTIVNYNSGKCLGVTAGGFGDGVWANQWGCVGNSSQSWTLQRVGSDT